MSTMSEICLRRTSPSLDGTARRGHSYDTASIRGCVSHAWREHAFRASSPLIAERDPDRILSNLPLDVLELWRHWKPTTGPAGADLRDHEVFKSRPAPFKNCKSIGA